MTITLTVTGGDHLADLMRDLARLLGGKTRGQLSTSAGSVVLSDDLAHIYLCSPAVARSVTDLRVAVHPSTGDLNLPHSQAMPGLIRRLYDLAGGDRSRVQSGRGGAVVDQELACAYLTWLLGPVGTDGAPNPPRALAQLTAAVVRGAEETGGLTEPPEKAPEAKPSKKSRTKAT